MDRGDFGELVVAYLRRDHGDRTFTFDREHFRVRCKDEAGSTSFLNLANVYEDHERAPPELRAAVLQHLARLGSLVDSKEGLDEVRPLLVPRIRPRAFFDLDLMGGDLGDIATAPPVPRDHTRLAEHLVISVAIDRPETIAYPDPTSFGVPVEELHAIALANLRRMTENRLSPIAPGLWEGRWGDVYAAERMLLPEYFEGLDLGGEAVLFLPGSDVIYVVDSADADAMERALAFVDERGAEPKPLVDFALVRRGGTWVLYEPPGPLGVELARRLAHGLAGTYAMQKERMLRDQAKDPAAHDSAFIAEVLRIVPRDADERELHVTTWAADCVSFLPLAEHVAIEGGTRGMVTVRWADAMEIAGSCLEPVHGIYPPRWKTTSFPDELALARLSERRLALLASSTKRARSSASHAPLVRRPPTDPQVVRFRGLVLALFAVAALAIWALGKK
jgi:hypothetical protein